MMDVQIVDKRKACSTLLLSGMYAHEPNPYKPENTFEYFKKSMKTVLDKAELTDHIGKSHKVNKFSFVLASTNTIYPTICKWFRELGFTEIPATYNKKNPSFAILFIIPIHELLPRIDSTLEVLHKPYEEPKIKVIS